MSFLAQLQLPCKQFNFSDSDGIVFTGSENLTLVSPRSLQFTVETWIKGNQITGDYISVTHNNVPVFKLSVSGADIVIS